MLTHWLDQEHVLCNQSEGWILSNDTLEWVPWEDTEPLSIYQMAAGEPSSRPTDTNSWWMPTLSMLSQDGLEFDYQGSIIWRSFSKIHHFWLSRLPHWLHHTVNNHGALAAVLHAHAADTLLPFQSVPVFHRINLQIAMPMTLRLLVVWLFGQSNLTHMGALSLHDLTLWLSKMDTTPRPLYMGIMVSSEFWSSFSMPCTHQYSGHRIAQVGTLKPLSMFLMSKDGPIQGHWQFLLFTPAGQFKVNGNISHQQQWADSRSSAFNHICTSGPIHGYQQFSSWTTMGLLIIISTSLSYQNGMIQSHWQVFPWETMGQLKIMSSSPHGKQGAHS